MSKYKTMFRTILVALGILSLYVVVTSLLSPLLVVNILGVWILFANGYLIKIGWMVTSFIDEL